MSQRGWVGWILDNKVVAGGIALAAAIALIGIGVASTRSSPSNKVSAGAPRTTNTQPGSTEQPGATGTTVPASTGGPTSLAGGATPGTGPGSPGGGGGLTITPASISPNVIPGTQAGPACTPQADSETGVSPTQVRIGQIVSDVSVLPAQLKPNYYGLQAYVNLVNSSGGICGRKLVIDYSNDNSNPAQHEYSTMIHSDFAFVANSSLLDSEDYQTDAPFNPTTQDKGEYVPDVGGLAYSYGRNQSPWFAGTIGSLSPSLTGGLGYKTIVDRAKTSPKGPCRKAGVAYLREPTGASQDQGRLGEIALAAPWGANLGAANVKEYVNNLADPEAAYEVTVQQMVSDGVNCVFTYSDLGSDINLTKALTDQGYWPPDKCVRGPQCFATVYVPFAAYDPSFITKAGDGARFVQTFIPHLPLNETGNPQYALFLKWLKTVPGATPSSFSMIGFASGVMFAQALEACDPAPSRVCVMTYLRGLKDFTGAGLMGPVTPFQSTRVNCASGCGNFTGHGTYDFKWIFVCSVGLQVQDRNGVRDFYRVGPSTGYSCDTLRVAPGRGVPA